MNFAELYESVNKLQSRDTKEIMDDFSHKIRWRPNGHDKLLDVGCASGNTLMNHIYPLLPTSFEAVVGIDISEEMIKFARKKIEHNKKCSFQVLDIATKDLPAELCGQFDHVTSFFCLHWVHDQNTALTNIYNLLRSEGGDCLFGIVITHPVYDIYLVMHQTNKWRSYMQDINLQVSPLHCRKDPTGDYLQLLEKAGFTNCHLEVRQNAFTHDNLQDLKDFYKAICPFMDRMTTQLQEEFLNDFVKIAEKSDIHNFNIEIVNQKFTFHYKVLAVYAEKRSQLNCC